ncbi:MAG: Tfp pilus assembly protein FimT/FimU, partial [Alphaproteobacteria bacterium]
MTKIMQTGRSMLEMLGVLAIIGVLVSIAIWGIKYALDKNIANDVLNDVEICQLQLKERDEIISEMREISFSKKTDYDYYGQD